MSHYSLPNDLCTKISINSVQFQFLIKAFEEVRT